MDGAGEKTVRNWEAGTSAPDAEALARLAHAGGDVLYVVTGRRAALAAGESVAPALSASHRAVNRILLLDLDEGDAELVVSLARRLGTKGKVQ